MVCLETVKAKSVFTLIENEQWTKRVLQSADFPIWIFHSDAGVKNSLTISSG